MYTGIVQGIGKVINIEDNNNYKTITIEFPEELTENIIIGCSISINGCCLSVIKKENNKIISFNVIKETLNLTNLKYLSINQFVNIERSARLNDEIGGHVLAGHIVDVARIVKIQDSSDDCCSMELELNNQDLMKYVFYKGYIGVDGMSITIGNVLEKSFFLHFIPQTMKMTTTQFKKEGDLFNVEIDSQTQIIVNTVERVLKENYSCMNKMQNNCLSEKS